MSTQNMGNVMLDNAPALAPCLGYALLWLALRYIFYTCMRAYWSKLPPGSRLKDVGLQGKVLEESYAILGSVVALVLGLLAMQDSDRGGCGLLRTTECFRGWPADLPPRAASIAAYHTAELGWYLHYLLKHPLGMGLQDDHFMHVHHGATVVLLFISFSANLYRSGILVLFVLNMSNTPLHVAKVLHYAEAPGDKVAFLLFAVAFFVSRIVIYPLVVLRATALESVRVCELFQVPGPARNLYFTANLLLFVLMGLQVYWFMGIVRVLRMALGGSREDFRKETKVHDYTKTEKGE